MKTFKDLTFNKMPEYGLSYTANKSAILYFDNGYGVSVLLGKNCYSNGVDTYELAVLFGDDITYNTPITNDVLGWLTEDDVTKTMAEVQKLS